MLDELRYAISAELARMTTAELLGAGTGIFGALLGGVVLRVLIAVTGWAAGFIGAFIGAVFLIWLWRVWIASKRR